MKKKLFKYIKFLVSLTLILSLVAPSYASLSASDGSAFVTKAEFDSALADFNARLTTFEAGINSKIDSQVTSYLDRNGIWSGKAQVLSHDAKYGKVCNTQLLTWSYGEQRCYFIKGLKAEINDSTSVWDYSNKSLFCWGFPKEGTYSSPCFICEDKINKSGLLNLILSYRSEWFCGSSYLTDVANSGVAKYNALTDEQKLATSVYQIQYPGTTGNYANLICYSPNSMGSATLFLSLEVYIGTDVASGSLCDTKLISNTTFKNILDGMGGSTQNDAAHKALHGGGLGVFNFFVQKDDKVFAVLKWNVVGRGEYFIGYTSNASNYAPNIIRVERAMVY